MTTLLCLNPRSRSGNTIDSSSLIERLAVLGPVILHWLGENDDLEATIAALEGELKRIVVGGGDGTLHRTLPAVLEANVPLGVLPLGTANDFARSLSLPAKVDGALDVVLAGETRQVGLGLANGHWFLNAAGIGLGPELTKTIDHERKRRLGVLAYLRGLIEVIGNRRRRRALLWIDDTRYRVRFMQITVANGIHYGGGLTIAQDARLDDGRLHVLLLQPQTALELVAKFLALRWGPSKSQEHNKMRLFHAEGVRIETVGIHDVTLDGEIVTHTPLECRSAPQALEVYAARPER